jgi:hypothetical protein
VIQTKSGERCTDTKEEIDLALSNMRNTAKANGLSEKGPIYLADLLHKHRHVWCIKMGNDPPAKIAPMVLKLKPGAKPVHAPLSCYAPRRLAFVTSYAEALEKIGATRLNISCPWMACPHAVPKHAPEIFRFAIDMRPVNDLIEPIHSMMPHIESAVANLKYSKVFAKLDLSNGCWQIPVAEESQECQSFGNFRKYMDTE